MKINGMGTRSSSRIIRFEDEVFVPKGFLCSVQLHILEPCWYTKVTKPKPLSEFFARDGQLLLNNVTFRASGVSKIVPRVCPISKVLLRPVSNDCILLQD
jgi:hypothetical protein